MRRWSLLLAFCLVAATFLVESPLEAAATFTDSYTFADPPSWQTGSVRTQRGSAVKHSSPVVADMGSEGRLVIVGTQSGKLYAFRYANGKLSKAWDTGNAINTYIDSSPTVADLYNDNCPEVLVGAGNEYRPYNSGVHVFDCHGRKHRFWKAPGHAKANHVGVFSTIAVGDITGDGKKDVVYGSFNQKIYAKDRSGNDLPGWPRENYDTIWSSPAIANIDKKGNNEVVIGTDLGGGAAVWTCKKGIRGTLSAFNGKGSFMPAYPRCMDTPIWSSPAIADLNGDGLPDVAVGTNNYLEGGRQVGAERVVRAWTARSGRLMWDTAIGSGHRAFASPAVGDVGGDGTLDIAFGTVAASGYGETWMLDAKTGKVMWHREGGRYSGCGCGFMGSPVMADVTGDGKAEVIAASTDGGVNAWDRKGNAVIRNLHAPANASAMFFNSPAFSDLDKDGDLEMVLASAVKGSSPRRGRIWVVATPGKGTPPWPVFRKNAARRGN
jgi:outer membrane protein assembly factor BamB